MASVTLSWAISSVELTYRLGELTLGSVAFCMRALETHFTALPDDVYEGASEQLATPEVEGILLRSCPVSRRLSRLSWTGRALRYVPMQYERYYVKLDGTFENYLLKFSSSSRSTLKRKVRRFTEAAGGKLQWREYSTPAEMVEFHTAARQISRTTYQELLLGAGLPDEPDFVTSMIRLADRKAVRAYVLFLDNCPAAYMFCPALNQTILLYPYLGYDPHFRDLSPGTVLQYLVLERLFEDGQFSLFDFTEGQGPQKISFATGSRACADIYYFRWRPRPIAFALLHAAIDGLSSTAGRALQGLGAKRHVRNVFRILALRAVERDARKVNKVTHKGRSVRS